MKSTVFRCAGFHFIYPLLVVPSKQGFSSWLNIIPSFSWGIHLTYFLIMNSVMLNLGQVSLKKSFMRTQIRLGLIQSISLHFRKLDMQSSLSLRGSGQIFLPRWTKASKTRNLICPPPSLMIYPSNIYITDRFSLPIYENGAYSWQEIAIQAKQATNLPCPCLLTKQHQVNGSISFVQTSRFSSLKGTLATIRRYLTPSVFQQTKQGDFLFWFRELKIQLHESFVMETGCPPKKDNLFLPSYHILSSYFIIWTGRSTFLPGRSTVIVLGAGLYSSSQTEESFSSSDIILSTQLIKQSSHYLQQSIIKKSLLAIDQWQSSSTENRLVQNETIKQQFCQQQMQFFSKYKNLFEIPTGLSIPQSRLKLDNELFVQKVYQGTTKQEYSLNNKLRQLKKDYSQFQSQMNELTAMRKTPKRSVSRKGKEAEQKVFGVSQKNNQNRQFEERKIQGIQRQKKIDYQRQKQKMVQDMMKRQSWLQDQHKNILKHSQIDHIFNNKLNKIYDLDEIKISTLPKVEQIDHFSMDNQSKRNNFLIKQRSKRNIDGKGPLNQRKGNTSMQNARSRREKAKDTLQYRRKKLQQLLKSLW